MLVCFSAAALADLFFPALPLCYSRLMFPEPFLLLSLFISSFIPPLKNIINTPVSVLCYGTYKDE